MIDNITNTEPQQRYINTVNGTYDNVEKRIIYGMPPVPRVSMQESDDTTNDAVKTSDIPANTSARVNEPSVNDGSAAPTGNGQITGLERQNGTPTSNSNKMPNHVEVSADALTDLPAGELPADYLLPEVEHLANTIAYVMDCSRDIVISTMFAVVSGAVGTKVKVFDGKYTNMLNINVCHVAPPGSNKTQPVSLLVKPLENISIRKNTEYKEEKKRCQEMKEVSDMPYPQILYVSNPTPEAINKMLAYNPHGLFARRDELVGFIEDLGGRYSNGSGGIPDFLSIFTNEHISIIRAAEEPLIIPKPYLTVVGGIQPGILPSVIGKEQMINSGFNYRWLFVAPEIRISLERSMVGIDPNQLDYWEQLVVKYHNMKPMTLYFDDAAQQLLSDYFREIRMKKVGGDEVYMDEVRDKLFIYLEKWAALATLLHGDNIEFFGNQPKHLMGDTFVDGTPCEPIITAEAVEYAIRCMHVFEGWAEKVRNMLPMQGNKRQISLGEAIRTINSIHPIKNKTKFAESFGISRQMLHRYLPKDETESNNQLSINTEFTHENTGNADVH